MTVPDSVYITVSMRSSKEPSSPFWLGSFRGAQIAKPFIIISSRSSEGAEESCRIVGELSISKTDLSIPEIDVVLAVDESDVNLNEVRNASDLSEELHASLLLAIKDFFGDKSVLSKYLDFNSMRSIYTA